MTRYADIVLPLAQGLFTYKVEEGLSVKEGQAVVIPLGHPTEKFYTGIVWRCHAEEPKFKRIKSVVRILYTTELLNCEQRKFWEWIAQYYMCTLGEVMRIALPALMKPTGRSDEELALEEFRSRSEYYISLPIYNREEFEELLAKRAKRAPKQHAALREIAKNLEGSTSQKFPRRLLSADLPTLQALAKKGDILLERGDIIEEQIQGKLFSLPKLSEHQKRALESLQESFATKSTALLHGVTGSGKTEVYIHLIAQRLERGEDVLLLLPEIALTAQLVERMERIFGSRAVAYHSKLTTRKRTEIYLQIAGREGGNFIVGVRSAIFLPLKRLSLTIIDEEHDSSYKQSDTAPRYSARDAAVYIAASRGVNTLLGSATPSLESWTNAQSGKYGLATLKERYGDAQEPEVIVSDTIRSVKRGERRGHFNFDLLERIGERLQNKEQVILFQNRRGFAPYVECTECGWSPRCPHCNVTLTLHKGQNTLSCHYCSYTEQPTTTCPNCQAAELKPMGFGTEKIEEQIAELFPEAVVDRLDRDKITSPRALQDIIDRFERGETNILVGTQMITKGFDFSRVTLVGILNADNMLNSPDFRAEERAYQLMTQVAGRAGRRASGAEVVIQTSQPEHRILKMVARKEFLAMASALLSERSLFQYPPYARITSITMRHRDRNKLHEAANTLSSLLRSTFGRRVQGPVTPAVDKIRDEYIVTMNIKIESGASSVKAREILHSKIEELRNFAHFKPVDIICDVDPQ